MTAHKKLLDKRWISIGKSLPFSIYDSQRRLLLAQGHVVESERSLERLLEHGEYYKPEGPGDEAHAADLESPDAGSADPLLALNLDYSNIAQRARHSVKIALKETGESFLCWVMGISSETGCLLLTAPTRADKSPVAISKGQVWFCRMFGAASVFHFRGAIHKVAFEPYPYLHVMVPEALEERLVRQMPRTLVSLAAQLATPEMHQVTVLDLSAGGARIAVEKRLVLNVGTTVQLGMTIDVPGKRQALDLTAKIAVAYGEADTRHPEIAFYGLSFESLRERELLLLHGYVQQQLANEYDGLGKFLAAGARVVPLAP